jgi:hypothetical protein
VSSPITSSASNADEALRSGGLVVVFPGGDYDVYRPTLSENKIDFGGRTGYVKAALNAGVPIVPTVGIGGQETQLYLTRGTWLAKRLGPIARLARAKIVPISFGFPFGLSLVVPPNIPLPAKITMQVLPAIDIAAEFGENPDIDEVDAHVRHVMQRAMDELFDALEVLQREVVVPSMVPSGRESSREYRDRIIGLIEARGQRQQYPGQCQHVAHEEPLAAELFDRQRDGEHIDPLPVGVTFALVAFPGHQRNAETRLPQRERLPLAEWAIAHIAHVQDADIIRGV